MHRSFRYLPGASIFLAALLFISGCTKKETIVGNDRIVGSGIIVSELRTPGSFSGIQVTNIARVIITQDTVESLRVEADDNIIGLLQTSVSGGMLVVSLPEGSYSYITVRVYASMRSISRLESTGAGVFESVGPIHTDALTCRIRGTAAVSLSGTATDETIDITGAGTVSTFDLVSSHCSASISGTGTIEVNVTQQLDATIAGTGSITYAGNPPIVHSLVSGVGSIQPRP